ncbi:hypothetical protein LCGC14_1227240 [marine sediment metagenome]|uniref:RRM domain-containing protein n=1 Tax=marine sediment metagenome TaxID=412755 RepID=A0A0F9L9H7_9ZZZZ
MIVVRNVRDPYDAQRLAEIIDNHPEAELVSICLSDGLNACRGYVYFRCSSKGAADAIDYKYNRFQENK